MSDFLLVYRTNVANVGKMPPAEAQQHLQKWNTWLSNGKQVGWLINPGDALKKEGRVVNDKRVVTDGPFTEAKELVGGFSIVRADSIDAAAEIAKGCPCLLTGGKVEVRPLEGFTLGA